jgi:hypothetical protein
MLHKAFWFEIKQTSDEGKILGYASTFNNVDEQGDVVRPGAFLDTIAATGGQVPMLWQHRTAEPIGKTTSLQENTNGLLMEGELLMTLQRAQEALLLIKEGIVKGLSIGYDPTKYAYLEDGVRELLGIKLYEISPVTFPANEQAQILSAKDLRTIRDWESFLRDAGLPTALAKALLAEGYGGIQKHTRDAVPADIAKAIEAHLLDISMEAIYGLQ